MSNRIHTPSFLLKLIVVGLILLYFWPSLTVSLPLTDQQRLERAWHDAGDIGRFQYHTNVIQIIHPTARLSNAGRHSTTKHFSASGMIDHIDHDLQLKLWSPGTNRDGIELEIKDGLAYGRVKATDDWTLVDDNTIDLFAPGGDPLGFLIAAENVQETEIGEQEVEEIITNPRFLLLEGQPSAHYSFDINGPQYAEHIRRQMEDQLRREGELPVGLNLGVSKQYVDMKASGELWLNSDGLPVGQMIRIQFPPERGESDWLEAEISTTFYGWEQKGKERNQASLFLARFVDDPLTSLRNGLQSLPPEKLETIRFSLFFGLISTGLALLFITYYRSPRFYGALVIAVIFSMLVTPLLQSGQVLAFSRRMQAKQLEAEQQQQATQAAETQKAQATGRNFNPSVNPLTVGNRESENRIPNSHSLMRNLQTSCDLTISDGDCDSDGLSNGVEQYELGTDPEEVDSDGDYISDATEVEGFTFNNQQWYLNPLDPDSNGDSLLDGTECPELVDVNPISDTLDTDFSPGICANTDTDTTPDVFDMDNDGDGVPDGVDSSPNYTGDLTTVAQEQFDLSLAGHDYANERSLVVEFELRPTDPDHIFLANNVYDWPDKDTEGQIMRVLTNTLTDADIDSDKASYGDVMVVPVLEIKIPAPDDNPHNPSGGLPVIITYTNDITSGTDLSDWLDEDTLDEYGISVIQDKDDGTLYAYLPLSQLEDDVGDTPVALTAQMYYRPQDADWGTDHEVRLVWLVEALVDSCDTSSDSYTGDYDTWCANYGNWTSDLTVIQSYYEDFYITGLSVREDYSFDLTVIAQDDALSQYYENYLWQLADGLQATFGEGLLVTDTQRFDIDEISTRFGPDSTYATGDEKLWDIPAGTFSLENGSYDDQVSGLEALIYDHIPNLLDSTYSSPNTDDVVTLLTAREEVYKTNSLADDDTTISFSGGSLAIDLSGLNEQTYASLSWDPYEYNDVSDWASADIYDYLDLLEDNLDTVISDADVTEMLSWFDETPADDLTTKAGVIGFARNSYLSLYSGYTTLVADSSYGNISDEVVTDANINLDFDGYGVVDEAVLVVVATTVELLRIMFELDQDVTLDEASEILYAFGEVELILIEAEENGDNTAVAVSLATSTATLSQSIAKKIAKLYKSKQFKSVQSFYTTRSVVTKLATGTGLLAGALAGVYAFSSSKDEALMHGALIAAITAATLDAVDTVYSYYKVKNFAFTGLAEATKAVKSMAKFQRSLKITAWVGAVVDILVAAAIFAITIISEESSWGTLAFADATADFLATAIVAVIYLVLSLTVVGSIIVALIGLFDALIAALCQWIGWDEDETLNTWVCGGITGALTELITYLIYDSTPVVDMDADDRLDIALGNASLLSGVEQDGYVKGNQFSIDAQITTTLSLNSPTNLSLGWGFAILASQLFTTDSMKESVFDYALESSASDLHNDLSQGTLTWNNLQETFEPVGTFSMGQIGINKSIDVYLNEGFKVPSVACWGLADAKACFETTYEDTYNYDLSEQFSFDVLPNNFGDFVSITASGVDDGYRWNWDEQFPTLMDADGDSLISQAHNGPDPNDSTWDSDGDGLSDYWEIDNGFDPENEDYDGDGLYDYWEEFYGTNPYLADSDGDGLTDGEEFFHSNSISAYEADDSTWSGGWTIVYDYDNSDQPMQTLVSADPDDYDTDNDTILDNREFIYGYNPNLASVLNVLSLNTESSTGVVAPGGSVAYTATIKNELDNRVANGLLQAEFPVDTVQTTEIIGSLYPQMYTTLTGAVTAPSVDQTESTSLTLRAGAVIDTSAVNQIFVLNLDEDTGATTFYDATSNRYDFTAVGNPVANSGYLTFDGSDTLQNATTDIFTQTALSFEAWIKPTATPQSGTTLFDISGQFQVELTTNSELVVKIDSVVYLTGDTALTQDEWNHVVVTYDQDSDELVSYVNGWRDISVTGAPDVSWSTNPSYQFEIASLFTGEIDYAALHNYALSAAEVAELTNGSLVFYATFDDYDCEDYVDSVSHHPLTCGYYAKNANEEYPPYSQNGIVGRSVGLHNDDDNRYADADRTWVNFDDDIPLIGDNAFSIGMWLKRPKYGNDPNGSSSFYYRLFDFDFDSAGNTSEDDVTTSSAYAYIWLSKLYIGLDGCDSRFTTGVYYSFRDRHDDYFEQENIWYHLGLTYDGEETLTLYIDGEEHQSKTCSTPPTLDTLYNIRLGATYDKQYEDYVWDVWVDDLRFYSKVLSKDEMTALAEQSARTLDLAFDEPPGQTTFADDSGNTFDGYCFGADCPDSGLAGRNNQTIRLDGSTNYVTLEPADTLGLTESDFTVMAWIKGDAFGSNAQTILGTDSTGGAGNSLQLAVKNGYPYMSLYGTGNDATGSTALADDQWYHLAWVFNLPWNYDSLSDPRGTMTFYVNGIADTTTSDLPPFLGTGATYVGQSWQSDGDHYFDGMIDDLIIVKDTLEVDEIQEIMNQAPLVNLHLDEDLDTITFTDDSPDQNNATCSVTCPTAGDKGQIREAPLFAGDDSLNLPTVSDLTADNFSLGLWVKPTKTKDSIQYLIRNGTDFGLSLATDSTELEFYADNGLVDCDGQTYYDTDLELIEDQWNHLFVTSEFVDATDGFVYNFYLNGASTISSTDGLASGALVSCGDPTPATIGENLEGNLDEITLYDAVLNSQEIKAIYDYQVAWYDVTEQHLITIDNDAPIVTVNQSAARSSQTAQLRATTQDTYLSNEATWLSISAVDPASTIAQVEVTVTNPDNSTTSGWAVRSESGSGNNGAWLYWFTPNGSGQYTLDAVATDAVGNSAYASDTFSVDGDSPSGDLDSSLTTTILDATAGGVALSGAVADSITPASGVATNTVTVALYDHNGAAVEGVRYADSDGSSWQIDYPFSTSPYGQYEVRLGLEDNMSNSYNDTIGTVSIDDYGPGADVSLTGAVISTAGTISGVAYDVPYPRQSRVLHLHLEETAGATDFSDGSGNLFIAGCTGSACPTAGQSGQSGSALSFDGSDDTLRLDSNSLFDLSEGTFMAWVKPDWTSGANGYDPAILSLSDGVDTAYRWQIADDYQSMSLFNGSTSHSVPVTLTPGQWHHLALALNDGQWTGYVDGVATGVATQTFGSTTGLPLYLASADGAGNLFTGQLDEAVIYDHALSAETIYDIANPLETGLASAQIRYRHLQDGDQTETDGTWYSLTLDSAGTNFSTWQHTVPATLDEGPYKIDLKAADDLGNATYVPNAWSGEIDLSSPVLTLTYDLITDDFARAKCQAHDFSITDTNWLCPATGLTYGDEDAAWFTGFFSPTTQSTYLSSDVQTVSALSDTMTACDVYDHCTTTTITNPTTLAEVSAILTPTTGAGFYGYDPIEISGIVRSPDEVRALEVTANGQTVYTTTWAAGSTEEIWNTSWTPPTTYGDYVLEANLTTGLAQTVEDESEVIISVLYPDLAIAKAITPTTLLGTGDLLTYTITVTNSGNGDAEDVLVTDTLPADVSGSNLSQSTDIPAGQSVSHILTGSVGSSLNTTITNTAFFSHTSGSGQAEVAFGRCDYIIVTNGDDSGSGSLRQAIADACEGALITFANSYSIYLDSTLDVAKSLTVDGTGYTITVSGDSNNDGGKDVRVFTIESDNEVTFKHLNIVDGKTQAQYGAGIYNAGTLTIQDCTIADNEVRYKYSSGRAQGGGIYNVGTLTITGSVLSGNQAISAWYRYGGAIYHGGSDTTLLVSNSVISGNQAKLGGGIFVSNSSNALTIINSTLSGNHAYNEGGGIYNQGTVAITNSTVANNSAGNDGGGVYNKSVLAINNSTFSGNSADDTETGGIYNSSDASMDLYNSIVANSGPNNYDCFAYVSSTVVNMHSLIEENRACGTPQISNDPFLSDLGDYGGETANGTPRLTFALLPGSPAFDAGDDTSCETIDQRGEARFGTCDIGAFESQGFGLSYGSGGDQSAVIKTAFTQPLTLTVTANLLAEPISGGVLNYVGPDNGAGISATVVATLGSDGVASAAVTPNGVVGGYVVTATATGIQDSIIYTLTNLCSTDPYTVTNNNDDGDGSLRRSINNVCSGGSITFDGDYMINLDSPLEIEQDINIDGGGHAITIDGDNSVRLFEIAENIDVQLSDLNLVDGSGILNQGDLTLTGSNLSGHIAAALQNQGRTRITNTTFSNNSGHISTTLSLTLTNVTLSESSGDGLVNDGTAVLNNVTLAGSGSNGMVNTGTLAISNSIIAGSAGTDCLNSGTLAANTNNLIQDGTCSPALSGDPVLSDLGDYGGDTSTLALLPGSPALDAGDDASCETTDQRGATRFGTCDIGAFESQGFNLSYVSGSGQRTNVNTGYPASLQVLVTATVSAEPVGAGGIISYTGPISGVGSSTTEQTAATNASGLAGLSVTANGTYGTYVISATTLGASQVVTFGLETYNCDTPQVSNATDSDPGSLRQALLDACDGGVIGFSGDFTITLLSSLSTDRQLTIDGSGHNIILSGDANGNGVNDEIGDVRPLVI
ncbi:MAG: DUF11 domain-containing protein, partial [Chloroflexi bacterium]|nr:DUF11 domain-containing protein [Chloroflexota bacterium]